MNDGYFALSRKLLTDELWLSEPFSRGQAWADLIGLANYKQGYRRIKGRRVDLKRGMLAASERYLAERWQWSRGKVRRFLEELREDQQIVPAEINATPCYVIVNYDRYQLGGTSDSTIDGTNENGSFAPNSDETPPNRGQQTVPAKNAASLFDATNCNEGSTSDSTSDRTIDSTTDGTSDSTSGGPKKRKVKKEKKGKKVKNSNNDHPQADENASSSQSQIDEFVQLWNGTPGVRGIRTMTTARKRSLRARLAETIDGRPWLDVLRQVVADKFPLQLTRGDPGGWLPDGDWVLRPDSVAKVLEGQYDFELGNGRRKAAAGPGVVYDPNAEVSDGSDW